MKNEILSKALKVLEQRRVRADIEQAAHLDEIYQKLPQVIDRILICKEWKKSFSFLAVFQLIISKFIPHAKSVEIPVM